MGNAIAAGLALLALLSRRFLAKLAVAWQSPFGWLVPAVAALVVWQAPQMPDMIAGLADADRGRWPMVGFAAATVLLGWSGWHWMRAVIAARLGAETPAEWRRAAERCASPAAPGSAEVKERAIETAPRTAITAAGLLAGAAVLASYTADARGFLLDGWDLAILGAAVAAGRLAPLARRKLMGWEWFRTRVLERRWFRSLGGSAHEVRPWPPAKSLREWWRGLWPHLKAILRAAPFGAPFALLLLLAVPAAMYVVAWWPERLPAAPTAAVLALACLVPPLTLLHALLARLPAPAPNTLALGLVLAMVFVVPWNPPSIYSARQMALESAKKAQARPELPAALQAWRGACLPGATPESPKPVVIVAGEGGASRGALWLLSVMRHLDERTDGAFGRHVFAVSAVSGGSLGAATYLAAQRAAPGPGGCGVNWDRLAAGKGLDPLDVLGRQDFLAPSVATYFLTDTLRRLLPVGAAMAPFSPGDRAVALELAFERYWAGAFPGHAAGSGLLDVRPPGAAGAPHLLLNGTDAEAGRRLITSTFRFGSEVKDAEDAVVKATGDVLFADADDLLGLVRRDVPLSAAVTNSARFPFISPAGRFLPAEKLAPRPNGPESVLGRAWGSTVGPVWTKLRGWSCGFAEWWARSDWSGACDPDADLRQVVDGGYFENYGALTALELARKLRALGGGAILPVVVVVSNNADTTAEDDSNIVACENAKPRPARPGRIKVQNLRQGDPAAYSEVLAPVFGLYATRAAHGLAALHALRRELCDASPEAGTAAARHGAGRKDLVHIVLPEPVRKPPRPGEEEAAPMNWVLNAAARRLILQTGLEKPFNRAQAELLCRSLGQARCGEMPASAPAQVATGSAPSADLSGSD